MIDATTADEPYGDVSTVEVEAWGRPLGKRLAM
jgi:hypothetical protein